MHAVITRARLKPGQLDKTLDAVEEHAVPTLKNLRGFLRYYVVTTGDDTLTTVTAWQSREDAEHSFPHFNEVLREHAGQYVESLDREEGDVVIQAP